jgi:hypothetical protein
MTKKKSLNPIKPPDASKPKAAAYVTKLVLDGVESCGFVSTTYAGAAAYVSTLHPSVRARASAARIYRAIIEDAPCETVKL